MSAGMSEILSIFKSVLCQLVWCHAWCFPMCGCSLSFHMCVSLFPSQCTHLLLMPGLANALFLLISWLYHFQPVLFFLLLLSSGCFLDLVPVFCTSTRLLYRKQLLTRSNLKCLLQTTATALLHIFTGRGEGNEMFQEDKKVKGKNKSGQCVSHSVGTKKTSSRSVRWQYSVLFCTNGLNLCLSPSQWHWPRGINATLCVKKKVEHPVLFVLSINSVHKWV